MKLLSIDVEEWFHILNYPQCNPEVNWHLYPTRLEDEISRITDTLQSRNIKATFFCLGWVASKYPKLIQKLEKEGHQIGSHGYMHEKIQNMTEKGFACDLARSINCLEQIIGKKVSCYRAPGFSIDRSNLYVFEALIENGIEIDSSIVLSNVHAYGGFKNLAVKSPFLINVNGVMIKEFPIITKKIFNKRIIFSGGGYFRFFPYRYIQNWTASSEYVMTYFHYRDFDCNQPALKNMNRVAKFKNNFGIKEAFEKFKLYLDQFEFSNILEMDKHINWADQEIVDISNFLTL